MEHKRKHRITTVEVEEKARSLVEDRLAHFQKLRDNSPHPENWEDNENAWHNKTNDYYQGRSKVSVPEIHKAIEKVVAKVVKAIFPSDGNWLATKPAMSEDEDDILAEEAKKVTKLLKKQFMHAGGKRKVSKLARSWATFGTAFVNVFYDYKEAVRRTRINGEPVDRVVVTKDGPDFEILSIRDVYLDPTDSELEGDVIVRRLVDYQTLWDLRQDGDEGIYPMDALEKVRKNYFEREERYEKQTEEDQANNPTHEYGENDRKIELLTFWGNVPSWLITESVEDYNNDLIERNALIEVAKTSKGCVLLRVDYNPFYHLQKPIVKIPCIEVPNSAYGMSIGQVSLSLQRELNTLRNQLMDMRTFNLKRKTLVEEDSGVTESQLQDMENLIIECKDINGIRDFQPADFSGSAVPQGQQIQSDIQEGTGVTPLLGGTAGGNSLERTAEGVNTVVSGAMEKFEMLIDLFVDNGLMEILTQFWQLNQQFLSKEREKQLLGTKNTLRVELDSILAENMDFDFKGVKEFIKKGHMVSVGNILIQNIAGFVEQGLDPVPIVLKQVELMGWGDIIEKIDRRPQSQLEQTPEGEVQLLRQGLPVRIHLDDNHADFLRAYETILEVTIQYDPNTDPEEYAKSFIGAISSSSISGNVRKHLQDAILQRVRAIRLRGADSAREEG